MASTKNTVIAGDYEGCPIMLNGQKVPAIKTGFMKLFPMDSSTVAQYEVVTDEHRKSLSSGALRGAAGGLVGAFVAGPVLGVPALLAGGLSAKNKGRYQIVVEFQSGERSLIDVDDKIYKGLIKACF